MLAIARTPARVGQLATRVFAAAVQTRAYSVPHAAFDKYYENELAYTRFPAEEVQFAVDKDFRGNNVPAFLVDGKKTPGLRHLVPWAKVQYATSGLKGTLGKKIYNSQLLTGPEKAEQQIILNLAPVAEDGSETNTHFENYMAWLADIQGNLAQHIHEHLKEYRALNSKFKSFASKEIFLANMSKVARAKKNEEGDEVPGTEYVSFTHKMYYKPTREVNPDRIIVAQDRKIFDEQQLVRANLPWFDAKGKPMALDQQRLGAGDIVCLDVSLDVSMYEVHYGFKPKIKRVVVLERAPRVAPVRRTAVSSPFGDLSELVAAA